MRTILLILLFIASNTMYGQQNKTIIEPTIHTGDSVTVIAVFNKMKATKDGYYIGDYVVDISAKEAKQLDGKKIKISGVLNIVEGLGPETTRYDSLGTHIVSQGREGDTKHILSPVIQILPE